MAASVILIPSRRIPPARCLLRCSGSTGKNGWANTDSVLTARNRGNDHQPAIKRGSECATRHEPRRLLRNTPRSATGDPGMLRLSGLRAGDGARTGVRETERARHPERDRGSGRSQFRVRPQDAKCVATNRARLLAGAASRSTSAPRTRSPAAPR